MSIIYSILIFLSVILVHEFGHFIIAKINNIQVNEFSIGMGPEIFSKKGEETQYSFRALPIGGYVAMEGEEEDSDNPRSFNNAFPLRRIAVIIAGAAMNFFLAIILFFIVYSNLGIPSTEVENTISNSPAESAGILPGDIIISIDDVPILEWGDISKTLNATNKDSVIVNIDRGGAPLDIEVQPIKEGNSTVIGISPKRKPMSGVFGASVKQTIDVVKNVYSFIGDLISGTASVSELSGPIGIVRVIGSQANGGVMSMLFIAGVISANLGAFNLLPFPALDGGTIIINLIEMITKREVPDKVKMGLNIVGLTLLFGLILYVTIFNDILNPRL